jgi:ribosomal protein L7/L12
MTVGSRLRNALIMMMLYPKEKGYAKDIMNIAEEIDALEAQATNREIATKAAIGTLTVPAQGSMLNPYSYTPSQKEIDLAKAGQNLPAIKALRERLGWGLAEAKYAVDELRKKLGMYNY